MQAFNQGQIVVSDFSGLERQMYQIRNDDIKKMNDLIKSGETAIILEISYDDDRKNCWLKILTRMGIIGYVPSIWMKSV